MWNIILTVAAVIIILILGARYAGKFNLSQNQIQAPGENVYKNVLAPKIDILQQGSGPEIKSGDKATVHYVGTLEDGKKFDSSIDRSQPFEFMLGARQVIKGWELGVLGMKVGEKRRLTIPYQLGYGETGVPPLIPPKANLIFEVELLKIN